ncbi:hypothetical protein V8G54_029605 [Vigna mungo]|uniref:U6 snRNA-associated Sm-like protein LSm4 n=1 Tax=Vigna mungo TaxID=3915 RepID=A0AAQ3MVJ1_VIGMU
MEINSQLVPIRLPLSLLKTAQGHPMLVELKNGETYNGHLVNCDTWMNIHLREVICTSKDGDRFWRMPECYIRGNTIKYLRVPDEVIDKVQEETKSRAGEEVGMMVLEDGQQKELGVALKKEDQKDKEEVEAGVVQVESQVESEGEVEVNLGTDMENTEGPVAAFRGNGAYSENLLFVLCFLCIT